MSSPGRAGDVGVPHRWVKGSLVSLYGLGQSSPHELVFVVELGPSENNLSTSQGRGKCQEVEELQKKIQADEAELNDLLECLGIEEQKVEKLSRRLRELGEDVDKLLETENDE
ncbi:hypothetical protein FXO37_36774 [Capsicum annuum]|nr:hypothetical protein FXO37_36774 [Capsicum annuum]